MNETLRAAASFLLRENSVRPRGGDGRLADLAFGSLNPRAQEALTTDGFDRGRHLAFLPADALELDLRDSAQRQFGDYELLEMIGEGGMGVVYRARQVSLDREVAVKLLSAGPWASRDFVERFQREAQNAARMQHPNIVAIHEVGAVDDMHFFSMHLIRGSSLAQKIREGPLLTPQRVAALMRTIAEAVDYAHRLGVLHLDLKPANVLLDENGEPHVADFGLARRLEQGLAADNNEVSGTPSYMAPEQATPGAQKITTATDIWGLGAILYELLTGKPPFAGSSAQATLKLVVEGQLRSPKRDVPDLPRDLEAITLKCMARDVADRYASARALADDLTRFIESREVRARPLNRVQRGWRWARREPKFAASALLGVIALLAGLAATTQQWRRANANATEAQAFALRAEANASEARSHAAVSNERLWAGRRDTAVRLMRDGKGFEALAPLLANIEEQEQAGVVDLHSVERREFGMIMHQGVTLIDRMIVPEAPLLATGLSPDGSLLALGFGDLTVRWYDTATLTERGRVDLSGMPTSDGEDRAPRVLRFIDNHRLRVTLEWFDYLAAPASGNTYIVDLDRSETVPFPPQFANPTEGSYSADGRHALLRNASGEWQLWQVDPWKALSGLTNSNRWVDQEAILGRDARYVAKKEDDANQFLTLREPHNLKRTMQLPLQAAVTAWAESNSGALLAVGDAKGHLFLIDTTNGRMRPLPAPPGREITWVAFSEDDAWVAGVRWDGAAYAFDVASSNPLVSGPMQNEFEAHEIAINHRERMLVVAGLGESALWRLPDEGPNPRPATLLMTAPTRAQRAATNSLAVAFAARLLATASIDGEVRLWRIPGPALLPLRAYGDEVTASLQFDGQHLPDIAYNHVRVASTTGAPSGKWLPLPQPVAFAQLVAGGKILVAAAGPRLHVIDARTMQPLRTPIELPANPMRFGVTDKIAILAFGTNTPAGFRERLIGYNLETGESSGEATVVGPLRHFNLSDDGARLLTVGSASGNTEVFATATLQRIGEYPHTEARPIVAAAFVAQSDSIWLLARDSEDTTANDADLILWNARTGAIAERRHLPGIFPVGVTTLGTRTFLATRNYDLLDPGTAQEKSSPRLTRDESTGAFALSHDGRLLAHTFGSDVQVYDTAALTPVGPSLPSGMHSRAYPIQLAFSPDDGFLAGRHTRWVLWQLSADTRPVADLRRDTALLGPAASGENVVQIPSAAERARLRAVDPGPPIVDEKRPSLAPARYINGLPIPARDPAASPLVLDLTDAYTRSNEFVSDFTTNDIGFAISGFASGIARIDGVDYDLRGVVELHRTQEGSILGVRQEPVRGIHVPAVPIAAFHVLLSATQSTPVSEVRDYAFVHVHYRDGSSARLPIRSQREVPGMTAYDSPTPVGWVRGAYLALIGASRQEIYSNPRLPNPHPDRLIATIDLEGSGIAFAFSRPVFFAITAEPVIDAADSGNNKTGGPRTDAHAKFNPSHPR